MDARSEWHSVRKHLSFSRIERRDFFVVVALFALITSFDDWGATSFDAIEGLGNLVVSIVLWSIILGGHHLLQKVVAIHRGFRVEQRLWLPGLVVGLILALVSGGGLGVYAATATRAGEKTLSRLGRSRAAPGVKDMGRVAIWGIIGSTAVGSFLKTLDLWFGIGVPGADQLFTLSVLFAVYNFLPLPPLDGSHILYGSRSLYVYVVGVTISYLLLISVGQVYSYIWAICIGLVFVALYYWFYEA